MQIWTLSSTQGWSLSPLKKNTIMYQSTISFINNLFKVQIQGDSSSLFISLWKTEKSIGLKFLKKLLLL